LAGVLNWWGGQERLLVVVDCELLHGDVLNSKLKSTGVCAGHLHAGIIIGKVCALCRLRYAAKHDQRSTVCVSLP
jgi:hypothetical protein